MAEVHGIPANVFDQLRSEGGEGEDECDNVALDGEDGERLERPIRRSPPPDGGGRLGSARRRPSAPAAYAAAQQVAPIEPSRSLPRAGQRISVFWTDEDRWFDGLITSHRQERSRVLYDAVDGWSKVALWHVLPDERWRLASDALP